MNLSIKMITAIVLLIHGSGLFFLMIQKNVISLAEKPHKVMVHTVAVTPAKPTPVAKASSPPKPKPKPKPKPQKIVKKSPKKPPAQNAQAQKLKKAKEALAKYQPATPKPTAKIERLDCTSVESNYTDSLVKTLKSMLTLPEFGEVKIAITLNRSGRVTALKIVDSASMKNRKLVERKLKEARFSTFGSHFSGEKEHTFAIVLKNDF